MLCAADSNRSTCRIYSHHTRPARAHRSLTNHDTRIRNLAQLIWPAPFSTQRSSQTENEQRRRRTTPTTNSDNQRRRQRTTTNRQTTNRQTDDEQRATNSPFHPSSQSLSASHHQPVTRSQSVSQSVTVTHSKFSQSELADLRHRLRGHSSIATASHTGQRPPRSVLEQPFQHRCNSRTTSDYPTIHCIVVAQLLFFTSLLLIPSFLHSLNRWTFL